MVAERGDDVQRVVEEGANDDVDILRRVGHDVEVVLVLAHPFDDASAVGDLELDVNVWITTAEGSEHARQEVLRGIHQGNAQAPAVQAFQRADRGVEAIPLVVEDAHRGEQLFAGGGQADVAADLLEQRQTQRIG